MDSLTRCEWNNETPVGSGSSQAGDLPASVRNRQGPISESAGLKSCERAQDTSTVL